jgi:hypothetical protein
VDSHWFGQFEREWSLGAKSDVFLPRQKGNCGSGCCAHRPADERALTASGQRADQDAATGATTNPREVVFLVVAATETTRLRDYVEKRPISITNLKLDFTMHLLIKGR